MEAVYEPIKHSTLAEEIIKRLIGMINTDQLRPGSKLPSERELMEYFRVSRSPIREALHSLTMIGVLETYPGDGTYVSKKLANAITGHLEWSVLLGSQELVELMEIREPLEVQAAGLAAKRSTPETIELLRQAVEVYSKSHQSIEECMEADNAIHRLIAHMSGNPSIERILGTFQDLLNERRKSLKTGFTISDEIDQEFKELLAAIQDGDENKARQAMAYHLSASKQQALVEQINEYSEAHPN